jgi:plasmid stability protein
LKVRYEKARAMATLTLHDIDDRLVETLKARAEANARSVEAEAEELLSRAVETPSSAPDKWETARRIAAMTPKDVTQTDSVLMLREDRER